MLPHFAAVCKRGGQILRRFPVLTCHFGSVMLYSVQRFAWKEGTPGWAGTAAFSLKKATPKHFRLEVYPFFFRQSVEHRFYAPRSFAVGRFCFAGKWDAVCFSAGCFLSARQALVKSVHAKINISSGVQHKILGCPQRIKVTERCTHCPSSRNCLPNTLRGCAGR